MKLNCCAYWLRERIVTQNSKKRRRTLLEDYAIIEFDDYTLISGGEECLSLSLDGAPKELVRRIARKYLQICGYDYTFKSDHFTATVWENDLEVHE